MKDLKNFILTIFLTVFLTFVGLWCASRIFIPKWLTKADNRASYIIKGFYKEPKNTIDILFTGNSDVYRGVSPMEIYDKTGMPSYNFVSPGQRIWVGYAMLEEALKYQNPKVVFFNVDEVYYTSDGIGNTHKVYDNMKFGLAKIKGVFDSNYKNEGRLAHFLPIFTYHDRYKELTIEDFKYAFADYTDYLKGMDLVADTKPYIDESNYMQHSDGIADIPEKNIVYLNKMKELCEENDIEFVLLELPSPDSWNYEKHNSIEKYAKKNDLRFLDLNVIDIDIDWEKDTSDGGDHLNIFGAMKVSDYLSYYLKSNFQLENRKENEDYSHWNEHLKKYQEFKEKEIDGLQN